LQRVSNYGIDIEIKMAFENLIFHAINQYTLTVNVLFSIRKYS